MDFLPDPTTWVSEKDSDQHMADRAKHGHSFHDWINFDTYIAWVIANGVVRMKNEGHTMFSYDDTTDAEEWNRRTQEEYDVMIKGFGRWAKQDSLDFGEETCADLDAALKIFVKRFRSLWD